MNQQDATPALSATVMPVGELAVPQRDQMYALLSGYFDRVERQTFDADLAEKQWVFLLAESGSQRILGFSTLMRFETTIDRRRVAALFSGDTVVHHEYWGRHGMNRAVLQHMMRLASDDRDADTFWLLASGGYKTYRFLPLCFHEYFPRHDATTPPSARRVIDALARAKFGSQYDPRSGVLKPDHPAPLRQGVAEIDGRRLRNPHVAYFHRANPGHRGGDELVCIARLAPSNLTPAGRRLAERVARGEDGPHAAAAD